MNYYKYAILLFIPFIICLSCEPQIQSEETSVIETNIIRLTEKSVDISDAIENFIMENYEREEATVILGGIVTLLGASLVANNKKLNDVIVAIMAGMIAMGRDDLLPDLNKINHFFMEGGNA